MRGGAAWGSIARDRVRPGPPGPRAGPCNSNSQARLEVASQAPPDPQAAAACGERPAPRVIAQSSPGDTIETVLFTVQDGFRGLEAATDRRAYPLGHVARREARGVADDEGVPLPRHIHSTPQIVAVARRVVVRSLGEPRAEHAGEERPMIMYGAPAALDAVRHAADADIEPAVLLRHVPGISRQAVVEEPEMAVRLAPVVLDLVLQGDGLQVARARIELAEERAVHRAAGAPGADEIAAAKRLIDEVGTTLLADVADRVLHHLRAGALEQPGIELDPADGVLHATHRQVQPLHVHVQPVEGEEAMRISGDIHPEVAHHFRCDPAGAELQTREALLVEHHDIRARLSELPRSARARRPAPDDQNVTGAPL